MLEIIFSGKKTSKIKVICVSEGNRINSIHLSKEENAMLQKKADENCFCGTVGSIMDICRIKDRILVLGVGKSPTEVQIQTAGAGLYSKLLKSEKALILVEPIKSSKLSDEQIAHNLAFGLLLGSYRFDKYFTRKKPEDYPTLEQIIFNVKNPEKTNKNFKHYIALANAVRYGRDLCNEPANHLTPAIFADDIKRLEYLGLEVEILGQQELKEHNFNLLLSVAQGSQQEPKVAIIKWRGKPNSNQWDLGLVGKGVTFDSGGISIKPASGMEDMKQDMTGAAVVVSSLKALALQCAPENVIGVVGLVENMPSGTATHPGDIVTSMSGQTVEIINTDAEGRLVLADCLWFIQQQYGVKKIIDIATLTGATMRALGEEYAGLFSNNDTLAKDLIIAGDKSGEKLWRLPINKGYDKKINSDIADMKNIGGSLAGGSTAACFLQRYIKEDTKWAHLDIAGVDKENTGKPICPKGATAFGIRLLNHFILNNLN
ncbi:MAG: leucyl aminopeptidase [Alphaproteobacteria bacterium]|nr:leucyl aminopeptidase [Alphaproteobacteria bacterium]